MRQNLDSRPSRPWRRIFPKSLLASREKLNYPLMHIVHIVHWLNSIFVKYIVSPLTKILHLILDPSFIPALKLFTSQRTVTSESIIGKTQPWVSWSPLAACLLSQEHRQNYPCAFDLRSALGSGKFFQALPFRTSLLRQAWCGKRTRRMIGSIRTLSGISPVLLEVSAHETQSWFLGTHGKHHLSSIDKTSLKLCLFCSRY